MSILNSIQTADKQFDTQTKPILIGCNDFNAYVCKYGTGTGFANRLLCEYIAAQFMRIWELPIPDFALVKINPEHIPTNFRISKASFNQTCFGLKYNRSYVELTEVNALDIAKPFKTNTHKQTLLKIALFDCWLSNEDRSSNHYNLMFDLETDNNIIAIDNECIFNSRVFDRTIYELNYYDSLLSGIFAQRLFNKKDLTTQVINNLKTYFYLCVLNCEKNQNKIIANVPSDWQIDGKLVSNKLTEIFSDDWKNKTFTTFQTFIQTLANTKKKK